MAAVQEARFARAQRRKLFPAHLFADPAWDILLALYAAALEDRACGMDALAGTGLLARPLLRWIDALELEGLVKTTSKSAPARFGLTMSGLTRMECFFAVPSNKSHY